MQTDLHKTRHRLHLSHHFSAPFGSKLLFLTPPCPHVCSGILIQSGSAPITQQKLLLSMALNALGHFSVLTAFNPSARFHIVVYSFYTLAQKPHLRILKERNRMHSKMLFYFINTPHKNNQVWGNLVKYELSLLLSAPTPQTWRHLAQLTTRTNLFLKNGILFCNFSISSVIT